MVNTQSIIEAFDAFAPNYYANEWDNVGLLVGSPSWPAEKVLLTIDLTLAVLHEAIESKVDVIVAYHPPIFEKLKSVTDQSFKEKIILDAINNKIAIYSPHTALDVAKDGVNDWIARGIGKGDIRALKPFGNLPPSEAYKLITMCPEDSLESIRKELANVNCGKIGEYDQCSFVTVGTGTFLGTEGTSPHSGKTGIPQSVSENKLEMLVSKASLPLAIQTLRQFHPYEEPPIEIYELQERPRRDLGVGRRVHLDQPVPLDELARRIKKHLGIGYVRVAPSVGQTDRSEVQRVGLCAGAGGSVCELAINKGCDVYVTGEMTHHQVVSATERGCTVILTGHTNSERGYLPFLKKRLNAELPRVSFVVSEADTTLWTYF